MPNSTSKAAGPVLPLAGVRVLELGRMFSAPWAGQFLADMGAEVIKLEAKEGDTARRAGQVAVKDGEGRPTDDHATFLALNRNKKSIVVDIRSLAGQELVRRIAAHCDVFLENFKAGNLARHDLGYDRIKASNARIVYLSLSGFGQTGPYRNRPGTDPIIQAMSGYLHLTLADGGEPRMSPMVFNDFAAGMYAVGAVTAALYHRDVHAGPGQHIDLSLLDAGIAMMSFRLQADIMADHRLSPELGATRFAPFGVYEAADGRCQISIGDDDDFRHFSRLIERPELIDNPLFATRELRVKNKAALDTYVVPALRSGPLADWLERFEEANILFAPIYSFEQMTQDPQVRSRDLFVTVPHGAGGQVPLIRNPVRLSKTPIGDPQAPPLLAADTAEVLARFAGVDGAALAQLARDGVIGLGRSASALADLGTVD